jgi:hypothetical protein
VAVVRVGKLALVQDQPNGTRWELNLAFKIMHGHGHGSISYFGARILILLLFIEDSIEACIQMKPHKILGVEKSYKFSQKCKTSSRR